jgi:epoxyqueuosine reductase
MGPIITNKAITARAISLGAALVGTVDVATLMASPSHRQFSARRVRAAGAVIVLALAHPAGQPKMDWWDRQRGRTPGNRRLIKINRRLAGWLTKKYGVEACELPYSVGGRGVFLKDAAVLAGLGAIGRNNLLITPAYGPRVRLRALLLDRPLRYARAPKGFAPCDGCDGPCMQACPRNAFEGGSYHRERCLRQLQENERNPIVQPSPVVGMPTFYSIDYCRRCELACPVGSRGRGQSARSPQI